MHSLRKLSEPAVDGGGVTHGFTYAAGTYSGDGLERIRRAGEGRHAKDSHGNHADERRSHDRNRALPICAKRGSLNPYCGPTPHHGKSEPASAVSLIPMSRNS